MQHKRQQQKGNCLPSSVRKYPRNRQQNQARGHRARVQMLIHHVERRSGHRQREHRGHQGNAGPLRPRLGKQPARNAPATEDDQCDGRKLPEQLPGGHRNAGPVNERGNPLVKEAGLHLKPEKVGVVGIKRGIQIALHRGQIDAVVFEAGMVAHHGHAEHREKQGQQNVDRKVAPQPDKPLYSSSICRQKY